MPGGAIIGAALAAGLPARTRALWVGGLDVLKEPGSARYFVDPESISVTEAGPGGVSELLFTLRDPQRLVSLTDGMEVRYHDLTNDLPTFLGFIDAAPAVVDFGNQGRTYRVTCTGIEAALDWAVLAADVTIVSGSTFQAAVQALVGQSVGLNGIGLRAIYDPTALSSSIASPIDASDTTGTTDSVTVSAGTTLREGIRQVGAVWAGTAVAATGSHLNASVDFYRGLRVWIAGSGVNNIDYVGLVVDEAAALGAIRVALEYGVNAAAVRTVTVRNGASISVTLTDGSGKPGPAAVITDASITTAAQATLAARGYLNANVATVSGLAAWTDGPPPSTTAPGVRAGSWVTVQTSTGLGIAGPVNIATIQSITKTFNHSDRENWTVEFGASAPRASLLLRRMTRTTINQ